MEGKIKRIIPSGEFVTIIIQVKESGICGRTYTGEQYRNYSLWRDLKVGDVVAGIQWKDEERGIIDADSPVHLLQEVLF